MTDSQIIAVFMGKPLKFIHDTGIGVIERGINYDNYYHEWNNLMPVVEKIRVMWEYGNLFRCPYYHRIDNMKLYTPIQDVHKAVVDFIKWYNSQK